MYAKLLYADSQYAVLYQGEMHTRETAWDMWFQALGQVDNGKSLELSSLESSAIVNWIYMALENYQQRIAFTLRLLRDTKTFHGIPNDVKIARGVVYNAEKVELHFFKSVPSVNQYIARKAEHHVSSPALSCASVRHGSSGRWQTQKDELLLHLGYL